MDTDDYPLLNESNVMLVALKCAAKGGATPEGCVRRLERSLRLAGVEAPADPKEIPRRVASACRYLRIAGLLQGDNGGLTITRRGRETLAAHPRGVDSSVLAQFPEYLAFIRRPRQGVAERQDDSGPPEPAKEYDEGYAAGLHGRALTDNPYTFDTIGHLEWENGWCEARDDG